MRVQWWRRRSCQSPEGRIALPLPILPTLLLRRLPEMSLSLKLLTLRPPIFPVVVVYPVTPPPSAATVIMAKGVRRTRRQEEEADDCSSDRPSIRFVVVNNNNNPRSTLPLPPSLLGRKNGGGKRSISRRQPAQVRLGTAAPAGDAGREDCRRHCPPVGP